MGRTFSDSCTTAESQQLYASLGSQPFKDSICESYLESSITSLLPRFSGQDTGNNSNTGGDNLRNHLWKTYLTLETKAKTKFESQILISLFLNEGKFQCLFIVTISVKGQRQEGSTNDGKHIFFLRGYLSYYTTVCFYGKLPPATHNSCVTQKSENTLQPKLFNVP